MNSFEWRGGLGGLLALLGLACSHGNDSVPLIHHLEPAWGLVTAPVPGVISGENFLRIPTQHVGGKEPVTLDSRFEVHLGEHQLEDAAWVDERTLTVHIPEGLTPGWYPLSVAMPSGERVELSRAYFAAERPLAALTTRAVLERERLWVGEQTKLVLTVDNPGATRALDVRARLVPVSPTGVRILSEPPAQDVEPGGQASFTWGLRADEPGTAAFTLEVEGREESAGLVLRPSTPVGALQVGARAAPSGTFVATPDRVTEGQRFVLTLRVTNSSAGLLRDVHPTQPAVVEGDFIILPAESDPQRMNLAPGESGNFVWSAVAGQSGRMRFSVEATGIEDLTGNPVSIHVDPSTLTIVKRGALQVRFDSLPTRLKRDEEFTVGIGVVNTGESEVREVTLDDGRIAVDSPSCHVELVKRGTEPPSLIALGPSRSAVFRAYLKAKQEGSCRFQVRAKATDSTDRQPVLAPHAKSDTVTIEP
ncbi:MAG: hypothetical protein ABW123_14790 [Cystobacter sp.]